MSFYFLTYNFFKLLLVFYIVLQLVGKISAHFKKTPLYIMFYKMYANAK
jgi:hypothetical protein